MKAIQYRYNTVVLRYNTIVLTHMRALTLLEYSLAGWCHCRCTNVKHLRQARGRRPNPNVLDTRVHVRACDCRYLSTFWKLCFVLYFVFLLCRCTHNVVKKLHNNNMMMVRNMWPAWLTTLLNCESKNCVKGLFSTYVKLIRRVFKSTCSYMHACMHVHQTTCRPPLAK